MTRILVIDNYDSFVYTLNGYLQQLGAETDVVRNDDIAVADIADRLGEYDGVLLSPGPGKPSDAGISIPVVRWAVESGAHLLGVCLGHQAIAEALGATVTNADELMHGKTSLIEHDDSSFYDGVPQPFTATRYHSLAVVDGTVPDELTVTSRTTGGVIMGLQHRSQPVLTEGGYQMLGNWLATVGLSEAPERARHLTPLISAKPR
jgi:para-aminobenzoate synthetase component 2